MKRSEIKAMLTDSFFTIVKDLFKGNEIVYISTPITTGERFIHWYDSVGKNLDKYNNEYIQSFQKNVVCQNVINAKEFIKNLKKSTNKVIIDPTNIENTFSQWSQDNFYKFWDRIIKNLVDEIIFLDGWEYSIGCCYEYLSAVANDIKVYNQSMEILDFEEAKRKISASIDLYKYYQLEDSFKICNILDKFAAFEINSVRYKIKRSDHLIMKDEKLNFLVENKLANVAQFISFEPGKDLKPKYVHINGFKNNKILSAREAIEKLILSAPSKSVNIRSFSPNTMKGNRLVFNKSINEIDYVIDTIRKNSFSGKHSIINENIDINDGGVSGVVLGNTIEFSPEDTPKCVDKEGVCSLPRLIGLKILRTVYGFNPGIIFGPNYRVEFSIHPIRQGVNKQHTIIWEYEYYKSIRNDKKVFWPNRFSRFIGDKVFGLLIADAYGLQVPRTTVIARKIAPFSFGVETGLKEKWIRTCPINKEPGKYYSGSSWIDPFVLIETEEAKGVNKINIASIISQDAVDALYSGASFIRANENDDLIEGVAGNGDKFMVGERNKEDLPADVINAVKELNNQIRVYHDELGDVSVEWVYDGKTVWVVQLNQLRTNNKENLNNSRIIVEGNPSYYERDCNKFCV
jgi:hypothetical protein